MSYILDALKKADAQRQRESMPGLHAKPVRIVFARAATPPAWGYWPWLIAAVLGLMAALWWGFGKPQPQVTAAPASVANAPAIPAPPVPVVTVPVAPAPLVSESPGTDAVRAPAPSAPARTGPRAASPPRHARTKEQPRATPRPSPSASSAGAPPAPAEPPTGAAPPDAPRLQVSGSSYSENPAYRMLILNGHMYREGEEVAPDLLLEQIKPKSAQLKYKGQRYWINY
jgi:general secretion pathway protein B